MTTQLDDVYDRFFEELESDESFFEYFNHSEEEALQLAKERAYSYLISACRYMKRKCNLEFTLSLTTVENTTQFAEAITEDELEILVAIMTMIYYDRKTAKLTPLINAISASELKLIHSPASERDSYLRLLREKKTNVSEMISDYSARERLSMAHKSITYELPAEEESDS